MQAGPGNVFELNMRVRVPLNQLVMYRCGVVCSKQGIQHQVGWVVLHDCPGRLSSTSTCPDRHHKLLTMTSLHHAPCRPTVLENLKYGWIQFLATYIAFWVGLRWLEDFVFAHAILGTRKRRDTQPTTQHF